MRTAALLQFIGGVLFLPVFISFAYNELNEWRVYERSSGDLHRLWFWGVAPLAAVLAPFLWARFRGAWWLSLLLAPMFALGPWLDLAFLRASLHGGEMLLMMAGLLGAGEALVIVFLLRMGRGALRTGGPALQAPGR